MRKNAARPTKIDGRERPVGAKRDGFRVPGSSSASMRSVSPAKPWESRECSTAVPIYRSYESFTSVIFGQLVGDFLQKILPPGRAPVLDTPPRTRRCPSAGTRLHRRRPPPTWWGFPMLRPVRQRPLERGAVRHCSVPPGPHGPWSGQSGAPAYRTPRLPG